MTRLPRSVIATIALGVVTLASAPHKRLHSQQQAPVRLGDERGQTLAEYALILSVVAVFVIVVALALFRDQIVDAFDGAADCLQSACSDRPNHCDDGLGDDRDQAPCN